MSESHGHLPQQAGLLLPLGCHSTLLVPPLSPQCCCSLESIGASGLCFGFIFLGRVLPRSVQCFIIWPISCNTLATSKIYRVLHRLLVQLRAITQTVKCLDAFLTSLHAYIPNGVKTPKKNPDIHATHISEITPYVNSVLNRPS